MTLEEDMSFKDFEKDKKNDNLAGTIFIYGDENYLIRWAVEEIIDKYIAEDDKELNLIQLYGDNGISAMDILNSASTYSIFGGKRVVIVHNFEPLYKKADVATEAEISKIIDFAKSDQDSSILIFILNSEYRGDTKFKRNLIKAGKSYKMAKLDRQTLRSFIIKQLKSSGKLMSNRDIDYLIDMSGYFNKESEYSLDDLYKDIRKIAESKEEANINAKDIQDFLVGDEDKFIFNLVDYLMTGENKKAYNMFLNILAKDKDTSMRTISLLTSQFEMMYDSLELEREGASLKSMAKSLKVNEFRLNKAYKSARRFKKDRLKEILEKIYNIDRDIKNGDISADDGLGLFLLDI